MLIPSFLLHSSSSQDEYQILSHENVLPEFFIEFQYSAPTSLMNPQHLGVVTGVNIPQPLVKPCPMDLSRSEIILPPLPTQLIQGSGFTSYISLSTNCSSLLGLHSNYDVTLGHTSVSRSGSGSHVIEDENAIGLRESMVAWEKVRLNAKHQRSVINEGIRIAYNAFWARARENLRMELAYESSSPVSQLRKVHGQRETILDDILDAKDQMNVHYTTASSRGTS